nr:phosphomannomutase/phosphoglucomutase [Sessilibacter corallicola]
MNKEGFSVFAFRREKNQQPSKEKSPKNPTKIGLIAGAIVLNALVAYFVYQHFIVRVEQENLARLSEQQVQTAARQLQFKINGLQSSLDQFGQRHTLISGIEKNDGQLLEQWRATISNALPEGSTVLLLNSRAAPEAQIPGLDFRFTELDMINEVIRGEKPLPEAGKIEDSWFFTLVSGIFSRDDIEINNAHLAPGAIMVRLPISSLDDALIQADVSLGSYQLIQSYQPRLNQTLTTVGTGLSPKVSAKLNDLWSIDFYPSKMLIKQANAQPWFVLIGLSVFAGLTFFGAVFAANFIEKKKLRKHQASMLSNTTPSAHQASAANPLAALDDVEIAEEDKSLMSGEAASRSNTTTTMEPVKLKFPEHVFRAYDIRGLAKDEINTNFALALGKTLGSRIVAQGDTHIFVARDGRTSSPELSKALIDGIVSTGCRVNDIGLMPSPLLYYAVATSEENKHGVIVTASHNGADYNGFKIMLNGNTLAKDEIAVIRQQMETEDFNTGEGSVTETDVESNYIDEILSDVALMGDVRLVIDAGNGATSEIAPRLFSEMGCDVIPLHCEIDGNFPNHDPDPSREENLADLIKAVKDEGADLGVAFDGDGDRIFIVTDEGEIITADRLLMLFAKDIVSRNPGADVVYDVKCTRQLGSLISSYGGRPIMWKTGHAHMKAKLIETGALLGGEYSGHIFIKDRWYGFDDGLLVAARLLEIMSLRDQKMSEIFAAFPALPSTPEIRVAIDESEKFETVKRLVESGNFQSGTTTTVDGLRVDFAKGWGLVRASNTAAELTLRFEGDNEEVIEQLKLLFKRELAKVAPSLDLSF